MADTQASFKSWGSSLKTPYRLSLMDSHEFLNGAVFLTRRMGAALAALYTRYVVRGISLVPGSIYLVAIPPPSARTCPYFVLIQRFSRRCASFVHSMGRIIFIHIVPSAYFSCLDCTIMPLTLCPSVPEAALQIIMVLGHLATGVRSRNFHHQAASRIIFRLVLLL